MGRPALVPGYQHFDSTQHTRQGLQRSISVSQMARERKPAGIRSGASLSMAILSRAMNPFSCTAHNASAAERRQVTLPAILVTAGGAVLDARKTNVKKSFSVVQNKTKIKKRY